MMFELHCHSCHSRGRKIPCESTSTPEQIIRKAKSLGLSGIAITDHETTNAWAAARKEAKKQGIIFIPGVELETKSGHLLGIGINEPVSNFLTVEESIDGIHDAGGIAVAPHPYDMRAQGIGNLAFKADAVEIFNSLNIDMISNRFAVSKFKKSPIPKVVGSDAHSLEMIGNSLNIIRAHDLDSVLREIKKGRVEFVTRYTSMDEILNWVRQRLSSSYDEVMEYSRTHYHFPKSWLYRKMNKKFMKTSNTPWWVLAQISLNLSRLYGFLRIIIESKVRGFD